MLSSEELRYVAKSIVVEVARSLRLRERRAHVLFRHGEDETREFDIYAESLALDLIKRRIPDTIVVSEERGVVYLSSRPRFVVILDPVDGSMNYLSNIPWCSVSIAIAPYEARSLDDVIASAIASIDIDLVLSFSRDRGVFLEKDGVEKRVEIGRDVESQTVLTYIEHSKMLELLERLRHRLGKIHVRILGCISLELAQVALNNAIATIDVRSKLRNIDIAAVYPMLLHLGKAVRVYTNSDDLVHRVVEGVSIIATHDRDLLEYIEQQCRELDLLKF